MADDVTSQADVAARDARVLEFLRICLIGQYQATAWDRLGDAAARVAHEWDVVLNTALAQRLGPLVYHAVRDRGVVPAVMEGRLRETYHANAARALMVRRQAGAAVQALNHANVPVIVLKGVALAETVYRHIVLRPMLDVDVLIHREDLPAAIQALGQLGYAPPELELRDGVTATYDNEVMVRQPGPLEFAVDIHWTLFSSAWHQHRLMLRWFWDSARPLHIGNTPAQRLGPEATVLHLCGHLCLHHGGDELLWLADVAQTVASEGAGMDWELLLQRAQACYLVLALQTVLPRLASEWSAPVPAGVLERLRALRPSAEEVRIFSRLPRSELSVARRLWTDLSEMEGWTQRLRFAWILLFPSSAYMRGRYGVPHPLLVPLYYPYRWVRGLRSLATTQWSRLARRLARVDRALHG